MTGKSDLPILYSIRGWPEHINPAYVTFVEEMHSTGTAVIDVRAGNPRQRLRQGLDSIHHVGWGKRVIPSIQQPASPAVTI